MADRAITGPKNARVLDVTLRKRAKMGPFTLTLADGKPRVRATDDIVNQLCHFIGNRMIPHFWKCDAKYKHYKAKHEYTFDLNTLYFLVFENLKFFFDFFSSKRIIY